MGLRKLVVGLVGIDRAGSGAFDKVARRDEVLLGTDQRHLSFRVSILRERDRVVLSTVVQVHNRRGRLYSALVRRGHPAVIRAMITRGARGCAA